ncbi:kynurenine formamidase [Asbolus verrucosus]|uniref:Kynurenine formamidase n=1 Tax=Asbolus verrucosus TaxID=1661398 RepID=A0A482VZY0_ASBVE|nr:kynurenine formamidase [Asbolus verrucosus]
MNELHKLYSPSCWSKRFSTPEEVIQYHLKFIEEASRNVKAEIPCQLNIPYGPSDRQKFDIIGTDLNDDAPIFIFVHGGYWQVKEITRESYHFIAKNLHKNDIKSIFVGYDLCPDVTIPEIACQIEKAAQKCIEYAKEKKSKRIYFMGHSAGAHLVASLFRNFVTRLPEVDRSIVRGAILSSGVFDLLPIQKTVINEPLRLDEKVALEMSPLKQNLCGSGTTFYSIVGGNESPEFIKQSRDFYHKLNDLGFQSCFSIIENVDHFDIIELLSREEYELTKRIIDIIKRE